MGRFRICGDGLARAEGPVCVLAVYGRGSETMASELFLLNRGGVVTSGLSPICCERALAAVGLSPQQARIAALVMAGKPDKQIAWEMGLKRPTVRTYLSRMFLRFGVSDRTGLALRLYATCVRAAAQVRMDEGQSVEDCDIDYIEDDIQKDGLSHWKNGGECGGRRVGCAARNGCVVP